MSAVVVPSYFFSCLISIPGKLGLYFHHYRAVYNVCQWEDTLWPKYRICRYIAPCHYHHYAVVKDIEISNACQVYCLECVFKMRSIPIIIYLHVSHQLTHIRSDERWLWEYFDGLAQGRRNSIASALELRLSCTNPSMCSSFYHHRQIGNIIHWPLFRFMPWNYDMRCMFNRFLFIGTLPTFHTFTSKQESSSRSGKEVVAGNLIDPKVSPISSDSVNCFLAMPVTTSRPGTLIVRSGTAGSIS